MSDRTAQGGNGLATEQAEGEAAFRNCLGDAAVTWRDTRLDSRRHSPDSKSATP